MKIIKYLLLFIFLILILLTAGCGKKNNKAVTNHIANSDEINLAMDKAGAVTQFAFFADEKYSLPSESWIANEYSQALNSFLTSFKTSDYILEENDCDNFASMSFSFAQILHHNTPQKTAKTSLAFGEFWYIRKEGGGHAINVFAVWDGENKYRIVFYEPQLQKIVQLTREEIATVRYYRF